MIALRWCVAAFLFAFFAFCLVGNLGLVIGHVLRAKRSSLVIGIGGILGSFGLVLIPVPIATQWTWLPLLADVALPYAVGFLMIGGLKLYRKCREHF